MSTALEHVFVNDTLDSVEIQPPPASGLRDQIESSWQTIAPFWPLENLIAVNPLQGLETLPIETALREGAAYFQQADIPQPMHAVNRETIKWCQAFFDEGQATIAMPFREEGFYRAWLKLAPHDRRLHGGEPTRRNWVANLPSEPEEAVRYCLTQLDIPVDHQMPFMRLMLTTLSGWAAHIKYRTEWNKAGREYAYPVTQADYLAVRLATTCLLWPQAAELLNWHEQARQAADSADAVLGEISANEERYRAPLLNALMRHTGGGTVQRLRPPAAQLVFCIDVRSEPFRRALEAAGDYETLGFAGFFGVPVSIHDEVTGESYASCPVLLEPQHEVTEKPGCGSEGCQHQHDGHARLSLIKRMYQSVKYTFTTPFALVEALGPLSGLWMFLRSLSPKLAMRLKLGAQQAIRPAAPVASDLDGISFEARCAYASGALRMMGLTRNFAPLVILCGHGSATQNNAYATALDCGACGGRHGAANARVLAGILNDKAVRNYLAGIGIKIDASTRFIAAEHNTTTDAVELFVDADSRQMHTESLAKLQRGLDIARTNNSVVRAAAFGDLSGTFDAAEQTALRSVDWAQVRPEWGLARNACFIVGPRELSRDVNLQGRSFLHSYDWQQDPDGTSLTTILTAPMVVAQWINTQYLFSTLDNVAYGGGSKVTLNVTGKLGVMQGNASDLMHGLPLQSVFASDNSAYHEPQRLMTVVYAPLPMVDAIVREQDVLQKLFGNGWVTLVCINPEDNLSYLLERDLTWQNMHF